MCRLAWSFVARICDKDLNHMNWYKQFGKSPSCTTLFLVQSAKALARLCKCAVSQLIYRKNYNNGLYESIQSPIYAISLDPDQDWRQKMILKTKASRRQQNYEKLSSRQRVKEGFEAHAISVIRRRAAKCSGETAQPVRITCALFGHSCIST